MAVPFRAPRTRFYDAITRARRIVYTELDLNDINAVKNRCAVTINDVVMALCPGGASPLLETWGGMQIVPDYLVVGRDISRLRLSDGARVADMTSNTAIRFGVTAEVFTAGDYAITQRWSAALRRAGFAGIRYWARHDLAHRAACLALFGPAGAAEDTGSRQTVSTDAPIDRQDLLSALQNQTGITVLPVPPI